MGSTVISWTPSVGAGTRSVTLGTHPIHTKLEGFMRVDRETQFTRSGGVAVSVVHGCHFEYLLVIDGGRYGPTRDIGVWNALTAFAAEAGAGVEFSLNMNSAYTANTTLDGAATAGDTVITLDDASDMVAGEWLFFQDADTPTIWELAQIDTVDTGTQITLETNTPLRLDYVDASTVRSAELFPACVAILGSGGESILEELPGGKGLGWDLSMRFRTVT